MKECCKVNIGIEAMTSLDSLVRRSSVEGPCQGYISIVEHLITLQDKYVQISATQSLLSIDDGLSRANETIHTMRNGKVNKQTPIFFLSACCGVWI